MFSTFVVVDFLGYVSNDITNIRLVQAYKARLDLSKSSDWVHICVSCIRVENLSCL
jgi:hypothetical protein